AILKRCWPMKIRPDAGRLLVPRGGIEPPTRGFSVPSNPLGGSAFSLWGRPSRPAKTRQDRYPEAQRSTVARTVTRAPNFRSQAPGRDRTPSVVGDERQLARESMCSDQHVERPDGLPRSFEPRANLRVGRGVARDEIEDRQRSEKILHE